MTQLHNIMVIHSSTAETSFFALDHLREINRQKNVQFSFLNKKTSGKQWSTHMSQQEQEIVHANTNELQDKNFC